MRWNPSLVLVGGAVLEGFLAADIDPISIFCAAVIMLVAYFQLKEFEKGEAKEDNQEEW